MHSLGYSVIWSPVCYVWVAPYPLSGPCQGQILHCHGFGGVEFLQYLSIRESIFCRLLCLLRLCRHVFLFGFLASSVGLTSFKMAKKSRNHKYETIDHIPSRPYPNKNQPFAITKIAESNLILQRLTMTSSSPSSSPSPYQPSPVTSSSPSSSPPPSPPPPSSSSLPLLLRWCPFRTPQFFSRS